MYKIELVQLLHAIFKWQLQDLCKYDSLYEGIVTKAGV